MKIPAEVHRTIKILFNDMERRRRPMWPIWRELAATYLPYIHPWLTNPHKQERLALNPNYITSEGLIALRTQTAGLMNGITSPTRPWFKLGVGVDSSRLSLRSRQWLNNAEQTMYSVLAKSNFYNTMAMNYFDLGLMNMSGTQIFEDRQDVVRMQRFQTGEFYVAFDNFDRVLRYGRKLRMTLEIAKKEFGEENLPAMWREQLRNPDSRNAKKEIYHICERSPEDKVNHPADRFAWREIYWTNSDEQLGNVLKVAGYREQPAMFPRWSAELEYGASPAMDALADMRELVHLILKKGIGLEKLIDPPMLYDFALKNQPKSTIPGGHAYVPNLGEMTGARPAYQLQLPIQELREDIREIKGSIREIFHNDLFKMISQLDTVRSATEIDARREEKLVLLAHFLERFENDQLDPTIQRVFGICERADLFQDRPRELAQADIEISYVSILSTAQRSLATVPLERLLQLVSQVGAVDPAVLDIVDFDEFTYTYAREIGANPAVLRDEEALMQRRQAREQQLQQVEATATAQTAIDAAKTLSDTEVGGGRNALQQMLQ